MQSTAKDTAFGPNIAPKRIGRMRAASYRYRAVLLATRSEQARGEFPEFVSRLHPGESLSGVVSINISQPPYLYHTWNFFCRGARET